MMDVRPTSVGDVQRCTPASLALASWVYPTVKPSANSFIAKTSERGIATVLGRVRASNVCHLRRADQECPQEMPHPWSAPKTVRSVSLPPMSP
jgi:hypothetical protein